MAFYRIDSKGRQQQCPKQIPWLLTDGDSQRRIASILVVSRNTIVSVLSAVKITIISHIRSIPTMHIHLDYLFANSMHPYTYQKYFALLSILALFQLSLESNSILLHRLVFLTL